MGEHKVFGKDATRNSPLNPQNLMLLREGDRTVILGIGLVVMIGGTAIGALQPDPLITAGFSAFIVLTVAILLWRVYTRSDEFAAMQARLNGQAEAARAINGNWWQIVRTGDHPGLSHVSIAISNAAEFSALCGTTYNSDGAAVATFSSDTLAIRTTSPLEVYYLWTGTVLEARQNPNVSGIGRFRFDSVGHEDFPIHGGGSFTWGTPEEMVFEPARPVELVRFTSAENNAINKDNTDSMKQLVLKAFEKFELEKGIGLSEVAAGDPAQHSFTYPPLTLNISCDCSQLSQVEDQPT